MYICRYEIHIICIYLYIHTYFLSLSLSVYMDLQGAIQSATPGLVLRVPSKVLFSGINQPFGLITADDMWQSHRANMNKAASEVTPYHVGPTKRAQRIRASKELSSLARLSCQYLPHSGLQSHAVFHLRQLLHHWALLPCRIATADKYPHGISTRMPRV